MVGCAVLVRREDIVPFRIAVFATLRADAHGSGTLEFLAENLGGIGWENDG